MPEKEKQIHKCIPCNKTFKEAHGLNVHMSRKHFSNFKYSCETCGRGYNNEDFYKKHCNRHLGVKMHKCQHCGKGIF